MAKEVKMVPAITPEKNVELIDEYKDLYKRGLRLEDYMDTEEFQMASKEERFDIESQLVGMRAYMIALSMRLRRAGLLDQAIEELAEEGIIEIEREGDPDAN